MSWETSETAQPCACGVGKRIDIYRSDDWGRSEVDVRLECKHCEGLYVRVRISNDYAIARGRESPGYRLVLRKDHERAVAATKKHEAQELALIERLIRDHGAALVRALATATSRKALHAELKRRGFLVFGFESFSRDIREKGREAVLLRLIKRENFEALATLLNLPAIARDR